MTSVKQESNENVTLETINYEPPQDASNMLDLTEGKTTRERTAIRLYNRMSPECRDYIRQEYPKNRKTSQSMCNVIRAKYGIKINYGDLSLTIKKLGLVPRTQKEAMEANYYDKGIWQ